MLSVTDGVVSVPFLSILPKLGNKGTVAVGLVT